MDEGRGGRSIVPNDTKQVESINNHLCPFCGEGFKPGEEATRWIGHGVGAADHYPLHIKCMKQTRTFCPHLNNEPDSSFITGPNEELRKWVEEQDSWDGM
jgi:hypothetical protein